MRANRADQPGGTRRQWLASVYRWCALSALAILSARLVIRPRASADCGRQLPCQICRLLARCDLPRASQTRRSSTRSN